MVDTSKHNCLALSRKTARTTTYTEASSGISGRHRAAEALVSHLEGKLADSMSHQLREGPFSLLIISRSLGI